MLLMVAGLALLAVLHLTKAIRADGLKDRLSHLATPLAPSLSSCRRSASW